MVDEARPTSRHDAAFFGQSVTVQPSGSLINETAASSGDSNIVVDSGTGAIYKGMKFTIAGTATIYTVTSVTGTQGTDVDFATTVTGIKFTPVLSSSETNNDALTFSSTIQPLPPHLLQDSVTIMNPTGNSVIYVGPNAPTTASGFKVEAGGAITMKVSDSGTVHIIGTQDDVVHIIGS